MADLPEADRAGLLDDLCGGDAELRRNVEELLKADENANSFLAAPAAALAPQPLLLDSEAHMSDGDGALESTLDAQEHLPPR